ncbi:uncharacterized protein [Watersipora subatra]|uniref:uncharacterized protein isoform X2 n=1 Tax=Watersipora subatra TaxID=2589382 RepID=UPI00355B1A1F
MALKRATILKNGQEVTLQEIEDGIWPCPFCEPAKRLFTSTDLVRTHIHEEHSKRQVSHNGMAIYKCNQDCGVFKQRSHYHCPTCDKAVISRADFLFHLKGHDAKKGVKTLRGRKKTLATVMSAQAGVQHVQLFSHASLVVSPTILSLIDDQQQFWGDLEVKSGMTCLRDEGQQFCVLQGQYDSVIKANTFLEQYVLKKLDNEIASELSKGDEVGRTAGIIENDLEQQEASYNELGADVDDSGDVRRSGRKRKPNTLLQQYVTPKVAKLDPHVPEVSRSVLAIRQSSVAHILKASVEQECHVTLSKNIQSGEYQVHLMFPPPIITHPPPDTTVNLDLATRPTVSAESLEDENPLAGLDDDDADEDYTVDPEVDNAASEEEMDPEADALDVLDSRTVHTNNSKIIFKCNQCELEFSSIDLLKRHKESEHNSVDVSPDTLDEYSTMVHYCKECDFTTSLKQLLKLHISRTHREKQLECLDCGEKFGPLVDLKSHIKETGHRKGQHTNLYKQMVECKICKKKLQLKNLKPHTELVHEKVKPFSCELCGKMFGTRFLVKEHMESHKNLQDRNRPWKCQICNQAFFKKLPLDEHMAKHMGTPQYQCDQCPKKFYHQSGWKRHMQHHGEERPFTCTVCNKSFKTSTNLSAHKAVHTPTAFMCLCGKAYQQKHTLRYHQEKCHMHHDILSTQLAEEQYHTPQRYMCGFCHETFTDFAIVQEHVKQHVPVSVEVEEDFDGTLALGPQQADQTTITGVDGSGLEHLAMTAAMEQQNMVADGEGRTLIVTDLTQEQLQLVGYPSHSIVDQSGQVLGQSHMLVEGEPRIVEAGNQILEQNSKSVTLVEPVAAENHDKAALPIDVVQGSLVSNCQSSDSMQTVLVSNLEPPS